MYARVWRVSMLPENVERFASACRSVSVLNKKKVGYRGLCVLRGGPLDHPEVTVVSLWESLSALRASESEVFQKAVAEALGYSLPGAGLREEQILVWEAMPKIGKKSKSKQPRASRSKKRGASGAGRNATVHLR
jgi:heme-degrading monooxygenase HmoA